MELDLPREYVLLGLRFDRLEEGFVDAYTGDPALRRQVADEPAPQPARLGATARALRTEIPAAGLPADRAAFLDGQLRGLEASAQSMAGQPIGFVDEVEAYFQVRPQLGDQARYVAAHDALDALLPGAGTVAERYASYRSKGDVPPEQLAVAVEALSSDLRDRVRTAYQLPETEVVRYEVVTDKPWSGFNYYEGGYASRVAINADLPTRMSQLPGLVAHESYPGHHTEHCRKERLLVEQGRRTEHTVFLVNTPECLMAEGLADLGLRALFPDGGWGRWAQEVYADLGLTFDGELAEAIADAMAPLYPVRQDAALLLHDRGATQEQVIEHLMRWSLVPEKRARQSLRFLTHPLWRAYTSTYVEGHRLLSHWLTDRPAGMDTAARFLRLLDEPLTPARVQAELVGGNGG